MIDRVHIEQSLSRLLRLAQVRGLAGIEQSTADVAGLEVDGTVFVHLAAPDTAVLRCPVDQKVLLMEISPEAFFETDDFIGQDAILVRLDRIDDEELSLKLEDAWAFTAPMRPKQKS